MGEMSFVLEQMHLDEKLQVRNRHFWYKYVDANTFLLNRNADLSECDWEHVRVMPDVRFLTIFAENNNLSSFFQVASE